MLTDKFSSQHVINCIQGIGSFHSRWNFISTFTELHSHGCERWPTEVTFRYVWISAVSFDERRALETSMFNCQPSLSPKTPWTCNLVKAEIKFHLECTLHYPSAQLTVATNAFNEHIWKYWVSWLSFVQPAWIRTMKTDPKSRWPHGKKRRISAVSFSPRKVTYNPGQKSLGQPENMTRVR